MSRFHIYLIGVAIWSFFHERMQAKIENDWLVFGLLIVYVISLRVFAEVFGKDKVAAKDVEEGRKE